jgi:glycosyltransferase involved in cell wall biosynthesis
MKQLRIVQVTNEFSSNGGVGSYILRLAQALQAAGHQNFIIHSDKSADKKTCEDDRHYYLENFHQYDPNSELTVQTRKAVEILVSIAPDIIHFQSNNNFQLESEIRMRFPAVKTLHVYDYCPSGNKFHHFSQQACVHPTGLLCAARMVYKRCLLSKRPQVIWRHYKRAVDANNNNADYRKIIVATEYVRRKAIASGYPDSQVEVIPYFTPLPVLSDSITQPATILFTGRVVREKGLDRLLTALTLVRTSWHLVVDGDGPELGEVKKIARKLGLDDRIEFIGWADKERHQRAYQEASVIVVPSIWPEPFGLVGIEAMSYEKPVIAFNVGGISQWLDHEHTGFLIEPYDIQEMARRIDYLLTNPQEAIKMGRQGRKKVEREFVAEHHLEKLFRVYEEVMNESKRFATSNRLN